MTSYSIRWLLFVATILLSHCVTWTASRHHYKHNVSGHRSRHRRQGSGLTLTGHYIIPGGEGSGPWGIWETYSSCSRTCGGGVASEKRICLNAGTTEPACTGGDTRYFSCQTQDCPTESDFRAEQCAEFNNETLRGVLYDWVPYLNAPKSCELNCMPRGGRFYYRWKEQVVDGTRCKKDSNDVCVAGICQPVGCDYFLGSDTRYDKCRVCRGNGTSCRTISGLIDSQNFTLGYNDVLLIPAGATSIIVEEVRNSVNYLALRAPEGNNYYLNGHYSIDFPQTLRIADASWHYERDQQGFAAPDRLKSLGPTNVPIIVSLLLQDKNVGIRYEYSLPDSIPTPPTQLYSWVHDDFSPCSTTCGGGIQTRNVSCRTNEPLEVVDDSLCDERMRPAAERQCSQQPCTAHWAHSAWGPCSKKCGEGGTRSRHVYCEKIFTIGFPSIVDDNQCLNAQNPKPEEQEDCNKNSSCPTWFTGPWKPCDKLCGVGKQVRQVVCHQKVAGKVEVFEDEQCEDERPPEEQPCELHPCEGVDWVATDWSECSNKLRTRSVECVSKSKAVVNASFCSYHPKPKTEEGCTSVDEEPIVALWYASQWKNCSVACGEGVRKRDVFCGKLIGDSVTKVEDKLCDPEDKYADTKPCKIPDDQCPAKWYFGPWTKCSKSCDGGNQTRTVLCISGGKAVKASQCLEKDLPDSFQTCNLKSCNEDELLPTTPGEKSIIDKEDEKYYYDDNECWGEGSSNLTTEAMDTATESTISEFTSSIITNSTLHIMVSDTPASDEGSGENFSFIETWDEDEGSGFDGPGTDSTTVSKTEVASTTEGSTHSTSNNTTITTTEGTSTMITTDATGSTDGSTTSLSTNATGSTDGSTTTLSTNATGSTDGSTTTLSTNATGSTDASTTTLSTTGSGSTDSSTTTESSTTSEGSTTISNTDTTATNETATTNNSTDTTPVSTSDTTTAATTTTDATTTNATTTDATTTDATTTDATTTDATTTDATTTDATTTDATTTDATTTDATTTDATTTDATTTDATTTDATTTNATTTDATTTNATTTDATTTDATTTDATTTNATTTDATTTDATTTNATTTDATTTDATTTNATTNDATTTNATTTDATTTDATTTNATTTDATTINATTTDATTTNATTTDATTTNATTTDATTTDATTTNATTTDATTTNATTTDETTTNATTTDATTTNSTTTTYASTTDSSTVSGTSTITSSTNDTTTTYESTTDSSTVSGTSTLSTDITSTTLTESTTDITSTTLMETTETLITHGVQPTTKFLRKEAVCKAVRKLRCTISAFGCCPDKVSEAKGPFDEGCPSPKTCDETPFGCCLDGVSPALGTLYKGCPVESCAETLFGCCQSDNITAAEGNDQEGCPPPPPKCKSSKYGCCNDGETEAKGPEMKGCNETESTTEATEEGCCCEESVFKCCYDNKTAAAGPDGEGCPCNATEFGCCPDGVTAALSAESDGCVASCNASTYGCCPDGASPAHGPDGEGCCLQTSYGCCPDNYKPAEGPHLEGCGCKYAYYGCCPDNLSIARGPQNEGCGCQYSEHGCCPDGTTEAKGPDNEGCACHTLQFGCCPDGKTASTGPGQQGCHCSQSEFKCCKDGVTPAQGPDYAGCDCAASQFGCCPDGVTEAKGSKFDGCTDKPENRQAACGLKNDRGSCSAYVVQWFYDIEYGGCSRFWYGGCEGNGNRFASIEECQAVCVSPDKKDACNLPKVKGACLGQNPRWYFDGEREQCSQFLYGGCLGNANNFETREACQTQCQAASADQCKLPIEAGSCAGNFSRWGFNAETSKCDQFIWGGCEGNNNRFTTESACLHKCNRPGALQPSCLQPQEAGNCTGKSAKWSFSQTENRCVPFYFTGCHGNENKFDSEEECNELCPKIIERPTCALPAEIGDCDNYSERWYFDTTYKRCRQFYYGGCGGNGNNFQSEHECQQRCAPTAETPKPVRPTPPPAPAPSVPTCEKEHDSGDCDDYKLKWYFDTQHQSCIQFYYGGCGGNDNNFESKYECMERCQNDTTTSSTTTTTSISPPIAQQVPTCEKEHDSGDCDDYKLKWYFDTQRQSCLQFYYGGCGGNDNNFESQYECAERCQNITSTSSTTTTTTISPPTAQQDLTCASAPSAGNCSDYTTKWFFDTTYQRCRQFYYSGCGGNGNNFNTEYECAARCQNITTTTSTTTTTTPETIASTNNVTTCSLPNDAGPCSDYEQRWFFNNEIQECAPFYYGGCSGNGNNFKSEAECLQRCAPVVANVAVTPAPTPSAAVVTPGFTDYCEVAADRGPCQDTLERWTYDRTQGACVTFQYGGCGGNRNNFPTKRHCEYYCAEKDPCNQELDAGNCIEAEEKWFYDQMTNQCQMFLYGGCDGNQNRFDSQAECEGQCKRIDNKNEEEVTVQIDLRYLNCQIYEDECNQLNCPYGTVRASTENGCERCSCSCDPEAERVCQQAYSTCEHGVETTRDQLGCDICSCRDAPWNPCEHKECGADESCAIIGLTTAECRPKVKPGFCPPVDTLRSAVCPEPCADDASCEGSDKCCVQACGLTCMQATAADPNADPDPNAIAPSEPQAPSANTDGTEPEVTSSEGGIASLRCLFHGNPPPKITWRHGEVTIDSSRDRYRLLSDGALEIVSLFRSDAGVYICVANNSLGVARQEVRLQVSDPVELPARIAGDPGSTVVGSYGGSLLIRCLAYGYPRPTVSWFRGVNGPMVPFISQQYEARDDTLQIRALDLDTLGEYACQAYNGFGKATTWSVLVQAYKPDGFKEDSPYLITGESLVKVTPRAPTPPPRGWPGPYEPYPSPQAPVVVTIPMEASSVPAGSDVRVPCVVDGSPAPQVFWTKDGVALTAPNSDRMLLSDTQLTIQRSTTSDTGVYGCHARNAFSSGEASVQINVEGQYIPADCNDNPFFADCRLIVSSKFCKHNYYSIMCCKSCIESGQLSVADVANYKRQKLALG